MAISDIFKRKEGQAALPGAVSRISKETIVKAKAVLMEYQAGKKNLENRIKESEEWWKMRHWELAEAAGEPSGNPDDLRPRSAWLFHSILGKHADMVEAYPEPVVLPREMTDKEEAARLTDILPVILQQNEFDEEYSANAWTKNVSGTAVYGIFWDKTKLNGLGDISVSKVSVLNVFWQPGLKDIQKSPNFYHVELVDIESLEADYPQLKGRLKNSDSVTLAKYDTEDAVRDDKKTIVVDWYYKKYFGPRKVLHYCKFVGSEVLYATEDDPELAERGLYDDGEYPYVMDPLFPVEGSPCGFGYVDVCKSPQMAIDLVNQQLIKSAIANATPRWFVSDQAKVNVEEYADVTKPLVRIMGMIDDSLLRQIEVNPPSSAAIEMRSQLIEEMKYTSGNLDVVNGGTTGGVTAYSAIAALIDNAGRGSKDCIRGTYRAYNRIIRMIIERIRQFYDLPRQFRITGPQGEERFVTYSAQGLQAQAMGQAFGQDLGMRLPVFDVEVRAQKQTEYNKLAQNDLAVQLYQMGVFNPAMADQADMLLNMMEFKGKDEIKQKIEQNSLMYQMMQAMAMQAGAVPGAVASPGAVAAPGAAQAQPGNPAQKAAETRGQNAIAASQQARMPG